MIKKSKVIKVLEETAEQKFERFLKGDTRPESFIYSAIPKHVVLEKVAEMHNEQDNIHGSTLKPRIFDYVVWHRREESNEQEFYHIERRKTTREAYLLYLKNRLLLYIKTFNAAIELEEKQWRLLRNNTAIKIWKDVVEQHQKTINDIDTRKYKVQYDSNYFKAVDTKVEYILDVYFYEN